MPDHPAKHVYRLGELLTLRQLAEALLVSEKTVRDWIYRRTISYTKLGGRVYFSKTVVEGLLNARRRDPVASRSRGGSDPGNPGKGGTPCREDKTR